MELDVYEARERKRFENSKLVQKEAFKAFRELKTHEFRLTCMYKPERVQGNMREFLDEIRTKEQQS